MTDNHYKDKVLVSIYDVLNKWDADFDFYFQLPDVQPSRIMDVGCGTGLLTVAFAEAGHQVVGVDPAEGMLSVARNRPRGDLVRWEQSTLQDFRSDEPFDLMIMTGHAFQCLLTDEDILEGFTAAKNLLADNGRFVFETRNWAYRAWEGWNPEDSLTEGQLPDGRPFQSYHRVLAVWDEFVRFESFVVIEGDGEPLRSESVLRFAPLETLETLAAEVGLRVTAVYGNWDQSPYVAESSKEIILCLQKG